MYQYDFEDFVEEVKFQMTEFDVLTEELILDWEDKVRAWLETYEDKKHRIIKKGEDVTLNIKDEELMAQLALAYYRAVRDQKLDEYWREFHIF